MKANTVAWEHRTARVSGRNAANSSRMFVLHDRAAFRHRPRRLWSDRALMSLPRDGQKYELWEGKISMSPAGFNHGGICLKVAFEIQKFVLRRKLGKVCDGQTGFRLRKGFRRKTVLSPDVSFVIQERMEAMLEPDKFFDGGPDLVVEVLSPGDSVREMTDKLRRFFLNGTQVGWIVDPVSRRVHVHYRDGRAAVFGISQSLPGGAVLTGFKLPVRRIFE